MEQIKTGMFQPASFTALWLMETGAGAGVGGGEREGDPAGTIKEYHPEWGEVCKTRPEDLLSLNSTRWVKYVPFAYSTVTWKLQSGLKRSNQVLWFKHTYTFRACCLKQQALEVATLVDYLYKNQACCVETLSCYKGDVLETLLWCENKPGKKKMSLSPDLLRGESEGITRNRRCSDVCV